MFPTGNSLQGGSINLGPSKSTVQPAANAPLSNGTITVPGSHGSTGKVLGLEAPVNNPAPAVSAPANNTPQLAGLISNAYGQKVSSLNDLISGLGSRQQGLNKEIGDQYDSELGSLNTGHAQSLRDIAQGITQLNAYHDQTLRNLGIGSANQATALNNKVGVMTPYNNSATQVIATALSSLLGRQTGDVNQQYGFQQQGFNNKQNDAETGYQNGLNSLNTWKNNNLSDIARNVGDYQTQLNQQVQDANTNKELTLANMASYTGNSGLLNSVAAAQQQFNPNNITYNPLDHASIASAVQAMQNVPSVQQFNVPQVNALS